MIRVENVDVYGWAAAALARKFGVDRSTITAVVFNETWREEE